MSLPENSNDLPKASSTGSDKESMDRFADPPESSDCSNHSTTDKDSEEVSDSDTRHGVRGEAAAMPQPSVRPRHYVQPPAGGAGVLAPSRLGNPFARVAAPVVRSSADSSEPRGGGAGLLAPSRLGASGGAGAGRAVLRPSALSVPAASLKTPETNGLASSTFTLHPPKFNNPFAAKPAPEEDSDASPEGASTEAVSATSTAAGQETVTSTSGSNGFSLRAAAAAAAAAAANAKPEEAEATSSSASFVFGQNLQERVTNAAPNSTAPDAAGVSSTGEEPPPTAADAVEPGVDAAADGATPEADAAGEAAGGATPPSAGLSLRESAEVYEKQRAAKRKYEEVEVVTGEEDESNVLQINCKLYAFNKESCWWQERGRGLLRLNDRRRDSGPLHSRLVFRTQGSLRLVLNTKIWPGMSVEKPSDKDVRVTAMDNDQVKVFLIKCSTKDAELLFNALHCRLSSLKADSGEMPATAAADSNGGDAATDAKRVCEPEEPPAQG